MFSVLSSTDFLLGHCPRKSIFVSVVVFITFFFALIVIGSCLKDMKVLWNLPLEVVPDTY